MNTNSNYIVVLTNYLDSIVKVEVYICTHIIKCMHVLILY